MGPTLLRLFAVFLLVAFTGLAALAQEDAPAPDRKELRILRITPEGQDIPARRQIVVEFNRPVVAVGKMDRNADELGIDISPAANCQWRWLNSAALSCNLDEKDALSLSTTYRLTIAPKIEAEDGATIKEPYDHKFTTQRASVGESYIPTWTAPGSPTVRLSFNQPVTKSSVEEHLFFEEATSKNRHAAKAFAPENETGEEPVLVGGDEARQYWMLQPSSELPLTTKFFLKEEPGLVSALGDERGGDSRTLQTFNTFPEPAFLGVNCYDQKSQQLFVKVGEKQDKLCNPMMPAYLVFNTPVMRSLVKDHLVFSPALNAGNLSFNPWGDENRDWSQLGRDRSDDKIEYTLNVPTNLKAAQAYSISLTAPTSPTLWEKIVAFFTKKQAASQLTDEFGRLIPPFTLQVETAHRNPNYEMVYRDAVLEKGVDSDVPFYVNNLEHYNFDYESLNVNGVNAGNTGDITVPKVEDVQFAVPLGVRDMLGGKSGALYGFVATTPAVDKWDGASRLFAQVTPYQVYAKLGHFKSTVWVTDMATGEVVPEAKVTIARGTLNNLKGLQDDVLASADTDKNGLAVLPGTQTLDPTLELYRSYRDDQPRLFIRVDKGDDMALLPAGNEYEVQLWNIATDVYNSNSTLYGHMKAWGMTAQGIYRAGDTMQYKVYVRNQDNDRFVAPPSGTYALEITDPTGKSVSRTENVTVSEFGTIAGDYAIPKTAPVGWYSFKLEAKFPVEGKDDITREFYPMSVLVSDFTPAPFRVTTELNGQRFKAGDTLNIEADAKLHSGGPYGEAVVRNTITLQSRPFTTKDPKAKDFFFASFDGENDSEDLQQLEEKLNDQGEWKTSFTLPQKQIVFGQLRVESAVRDDRGKSIASEARADYIGVDRLVGLKPTEWVFEAGKDATIKTIVLSSLGKPAQNTNVDTIIERENIVTAKVKSAGATYTDDRTVTWDKVAECHTVSTTDPQDCVFKPSMAGTYRATATIHDTQKRVHTTSQTLWVSGPDYVQWNEGRENALTLIPDKAEYDVWDTAKILVKNPFPGATAYISVERYGVIDSFVKKLDGSTPVIEFPVKPSYLPGFYLSVVIVSPRADTPPPEMGQIDLGKPTFRLGYVKVPVLDTHKEIETVAKTDKEVYRPREKVTVELHAAPRNPRKDNAPIELAVAVLDESVFDLISDGRNAFDPYHGFYDLDYLDVTNYSLISRLVGRQKFEKKGANAGGDGGTDDGMRNTFKFVSYWNPSVTLDKDGNGKIEFEAPDNLTGWRILAIATTKDDLMGLGEATFKVNRPTELRPVMPNQVREGDKFEAGFSVMNRSDTERTIKVTIDATGDLEGNLIQTKEETLILKPFKRKTVLFPMQASLLPVTRDAAEGKVTFKVTAGDVEDSDGVEHILPVLKSRTFDTAATYATTTGKEASESIAIPDDIYTDSGDVSVTLSPSVIANLDGAFRYMRDYSYPCWEQKLSVAVMASHYKNLNEYVSVEWKDAQTLPQDILNMAAEYQAPGGGMAYYTPRDEYVDPYLSAYTALSFQWLRKAGYDIPEAMEDRLHSYLLNFLRNDAAPDYYQDGMTSTVRAVILAALKDTGKITEKDVLRFKDHVKKMSLFGKAHYLQAASAFPKAKDSARDVLGMILSSGVESGGKFSFNETYDDAYSRILATPLRDNCAVLDALIAYPDAELTGDKPFKLVRMITQGRGNRDHWENTQENLFCMNALVSYAKEYESEAPDMKVSASFKAYPMGSASFTSVRDKGVTLSRNLDQQDPGTKAKMTLSREGSGRLYYTTRLRYAPKSPADNVNAGIDVRREYSVKKEGKWSLVTGPLEIRRGDLVKVDLFVSLPTARSFVVLNDPLPGGLETVNRDLATASSVDAEQALFDEAGGSYWFKFDDWQEFQASRWSFYHKELRHDSARFYSDWLEPGNYHLSYMAQAVAMGTFSIPATMAEEMYDPDTYGRGTKGELIVKDAD